MSASRIHRKGHFKHEEALAGAGGLYPGMLVKVNSSGAVVVHSTEGGRAEKAILMEDALQGKVVSDVFTIAEVVPYGLFDQGAEANVLLESGQDIVVGDELISAGNGKWKKADDITSGLTVAEVLATAMEACDLTGSGVVADTLIAARIR
jgi:hypothetical protein